jgi:hypothetical protein
METDLIIVVLIVGAAAALVLRRIIRGIRTTAIRADGRDGRSCVCSACLAPCCELPRNQSDKEEKRS